jgi:hypothetical protein
VLVGAALSACADRAGDATQPGTSGPHTSAAPRATAWPLHCADVPIAQRRMATGDVTGDGVADTVLIAYCDAGAGSPSQRLGLLDGRTGALRVVPRTGGVEFYVDVRAAPRRVTATGLAFSADDVPRCCPDVRRRLSWRWTGSALVAERSG